MLQRPHSLPHGGANRQAARRARDARHRARVRAGLMTVTVELDAAGLDWLVRDARALDERVLELPDMRELRRAVGEAVSAMIALSARAAG
jgi:hypothetical protein